MEPGKRHFSTTVLVKGHPFRIQLVFMSVFGVVIVGKFAHTRSVDQDSVSFSVNLDKDRSLYPISLS